MAASEKLLAHLRRLASTRKGKPASAGVGAKISAAKRGKQLGVNNPNYRRGWFLVDGYRYVLNRGHPNATKSGYVAEHRLVMEQQLGRLLEVGEVVHHRDHNKLNNEAGNLELCASNGRHSQDHHNTRNTKGQFSCA